MGAELAHAEDHQVLRQAAAPADRRAELRGVTRIEPLVGEVDADVGQLGEVAAGFLEVGLAVEVAPDDAQLLAVAEAPQAVGQLIVVVAAGQRGGQLRAQFARLQRALQLAGVGQGEEGRRVADDLFIDEVAQRAAPLERGAARWRPVRQGCGVRQDGGGAIGQGLQEGGQRNKRRQAHGLSFFGPRASADELPKRLKPALRLTFADHHPRASADRRRKNCSFTTKDCIQRAEIRVTL
ncbi:hypothetical protein D9M70_510410 [compost metagenome]